MTMSLNMNNILCGPKFRSRMMLVIFCMLANPGNTMDTSSSLTGSTEESDSDYPDNTPASHPTTNEHSMDSSSLIGSTDESDLETRLKTNETETDESEIRCIPMPSGGSHDNRAITLESNDTYKMYEKHLEKDKTITEEQLEKDKAIKLKIVENDYTELSPDDKNRCIAALRRICLKWDDGGVLQ